MITNRDYFSWSQFSLFNSSPLQFYKRYGLGEKLFTPAFDKGKEFADYRETNEIPHYVDDPLLETVSKLVPTLYNPEYELNVEFAGIKLKAFLDDVDNDLIEFHEYKTGKEPWDQLKVEKHEQLDFYAFMLYVFSDSKIIPKCTLYWIETEEVEEPDGTKKLYYTGGVQKFERTFTKKDMINIGAKIVTTWEAIQAYEHEELEVEDSVVDRYIQLEKEIKERKNELDLIKLKIMDDLKAVGAKYASSSKGRFSLSGRITKHYPANVTSLESKYKKEINSLKLKEEKAGNVTTTTSEYILFKAIK